MLTGHHLKCQEVTHGFHSEEGEARRPSPHMRYLCVASHRVRERSHGKGWAKMRIHCPALRASGSMDSDVTANKEIRWALLLCPHNAYNGQSSCHRQECQHRAMAEAMTRRPQVVRPLPCFCLLSAQDFRWATTTAHHLNVLEIRTQDLTFI